MKHNDEVDFSAVPLGRADSSSYVFTPALILSAPIAIPQMSNDFGHLIAVTGGTNLPMPCAYQERPDEVGSNPCRIGYPDVPAGSPPRQSNLMGTGLSDAEMPKSPSKDASEIKDGLKPLRNLQFAMGYCITYESPNR